MVKKEFYLVFLSLALVLAFPLVLGEISENSSLTGKVTSEGASLVISITGTPSLEVISPVNGIYMTENNLSLSYTALSADNVWYNLDEGPNITLTGSILFSASRGGHKLYIYANNSYGMRLSKVMFVVNPEMFLIDYDKFRGAYKGNSTDFLMHSFHELGDMEGVTLEDSRYGKIIFRGRVNVSDDSFIPDKVVNLSRDVTVSNNMIGINSTGLPNFNKSATLYFYNLTFSNPRILADGEVCPESLCGEVLYSGGTLEFNVTHFTVYSVEESPSEGSPGGGSSRGVNGGVMNSVSFDANPTYVPLEVSVGSNVSSYFILTNTGSTDAPISLSVENLSSFIKIPEENFILKAGENKVIHFSAFANKSVLPDIYVGGIVVSSGGGTKRILVSVEVTSKEPLFDVSLDVLPEYRRILPGGDVTGRTTLYNLGGSEKVDVLLIYEILDEKGNVIVSKNETVAVETSLDILRTFHMPEESPSGKYILYVRTDYGGKTASASSTFDVSLNSFDRKSQMLFISSIIMIAFLFVVFISIRKVKKDKRPFKISEDALARKGFIKIKPEKILASAFKSKLWKE